MGRTAASRESFGSLSWIWCWPKHSPFKWMKRARWGKGGRAGFPIKRIRMSVMRVRVRADTEEKIRVRRSKQQTYSTFTLTLFLAHTPAKRARLPELNSQPWRRCPRHLARTEKQSDDITREWHAVWVTSSESPIIVPKQTALQKQKASPS